MLHPLQVRVSTCVSCTGSWHKRFLFDRTHCPCCLREYHAHSKVLAHLRRSTRCRETLRDKRLFCPPAPGLGSNRDRELADANHKDRSCHLRLIEHGISMILHSLKHCTCIFLMVQIALPLQPMCVTSLVHIQSVGQCAERHWVSLSAFCAQLTPEDAAVLMWPHAEIAHCLSQFACDSSWDFLHDAYSAAVAQACNTLWLGIGAQIRPHNRLSIGLTGTLCRNRWPARKFCYTHLRVDAGVEMWNGTLTWSQEIHRALLSLQFRLTSLLTPFMVILRKQTRGPFGYTISARGMWQVSCWATHGDTWRYMEQGPRSSVVW